MQIISVPFQGKGRKVSYKVETIDINITPVDFLNAYSVFIDDQELKDVVGEHFTILHNKLNNAKPSFAVTSPGNIEEANLKKMIAQQIMNNPTE